MFVFPGTRSFAWPRSWPLICIYQRWPTTLLPVRGLSLRIPTLSPQFVFVLRLWPTICITGPEPEYAFTLSLVAVAVAVVIAVVVIYLE